MPTKTFTPQFLTASQLRDGIDLFHLGKKQSRAGGDYDGLIYASKHLALAHPGLNQTGAYKDLFSWRYSR